jgi:rubrerythrin
LKPPVSEAAHPVGRRPLEDVRRPGRPPDIRDLQECEACGTKMYGLHCKIVCPNCGYKRDCSDP